MAPCWGGCGVSVVPRHHLIPKDFAKPGPDDEWNIIPLCGSGTSGCHGAFHGSPWVDANGTRRDAALVCRQIVAHLGRDDGRLYPLLEFLGTTELTERFFARTLRSFIVRTNANVIGYMILPSDPDEGAHAPAA